MCLYENVRSTHMRAIFGNSLVNYQECNSDRSKLNPHI